MGLLGWDGQVGGGGGPSLILARHPAGLRFQFLCPLSSYNKLDRPWMVEWVRVQVPDLPVPAALPMLWGTGCWGSTCCPWGAVLYPQTVGASKLHLPLEGSYFSDLAARSCRLAFPRCWAALYALDERRLRNVDVGY